jgi:pimeloyl-ACP methyl ester carboxylesterase
MTGADVRRGSLAKVAAVSLAAGASLAAGLTVTVGPAVGEGAVTGLALLSSAIGWSLFALLSQRRTECPQRWAFVPAVVLGVCGAALAATSPGDGALRAAGWIWPPVLLCLAVWCAVQMRRAAAGRARWVVLPVLAGMSLMALGGAVETVAGEHDARTLAMPGERYDIGGRSLHLTCTGTGTPTVVLEAGLGEMSSHWARIAPAVARSTRVCAYDRAGLGWSDASSRTPDGHSVASDLHALLRAAGVPAPYVLAGHSIGGTYAMAYAATYPDDVAGLVLLDSSSPQQFTALPDFPRIYAATRRLYAVLPSLSRLGVSRLANAVAPPALPGPAADEVRALAATGRSLQTSRDEHRALRTTFAQAAQLSSFGRRPLAVVTATDGAPRGWTAAQQRLAALSTNTVHVVVDSSHTGVLDSARGSEAAADATQRVVDAVRTGAAVATP